MIIITILIIHGLVAVLLLGGITHQAFGVLPAPKAKRTIFDRFRAVNGGAYTNTIMVLFIFSSLLGGLMYPTYRMEVRTTLEDLQMRAANGLFEVKEHMAAVGLGVLPVYWLAWKSSSQEWLEARRNLTWLLAFITWFNFLVGHVLNNIKGL